MSSEEFKKNLKGSQSRLQRLCSVSGDKYWDLVETHARLIDKVENLEHRLQSVQYWLDSWDGNPPASTAQLVLGIRAALGDEE